MAHTSSTNFDMIDLEIQKFYNSVKDPNWPVINNYFDFINLPKHIQEECNNQHHFQQRKSQIVDSNFWINSYQTVYQYKNLVYLPVAKCACTYYMEFFTSMGWKNVCLNEINLDTVTIFGTIRHPIERFIKGMTQYIYYRDDPNHVLPEVIIADFHSIPYHLKYGKLLQKVNWIPMDILTDDQIKICLMKLFNKFDFNIQIPLNDERKNSSHVYPEKRILEDRVRKSYFENKKRLFELHNLYAEDLKFFYNLLDTFDPDWQHIIN